MNNMTNTATPIDRLRTKEDEVKAPLALDLGVIKGEIIPADPKAAVAEVVNDPLKAKAKAQVKAIIGVTPDQYEAAKTAIDSAGLKLMIDSKGGSEMLTQRIDKLRTGSEDGGPVANALLNLRDEVSKLDPDGVNFTLGSWARLMGQVPFIGNHVQAYFNRFETGQGAINEIIKSLETGQATLKNDNRILGQDQTRYRSVTRQVMEQIAYLEIVEAELTTESDKVVDDDHRVFLQNEILFPLNQRIQALYQRLNVNQQGVLNAEILIRNNRELIRGVDIARLVTVDALEIAISTALALANQKLVLDAVDALNTTTNNLLASNAKRLRTQGAEVHKQAVSTSLKVETLKGAFVDIRAALDDITTFRVNALGGMRGAIGEMREAAQEADVVITQMEQGNAAVANLPFMLDISAEAT